MIKSYNIKSYNLYGYNNVSTGRGVYYDNINLKYEDNVILQFKLKLEAYSYGEILCIDPDSSTNIRIYRTEDNNLKVNSEIFNLTSMDWTSEHIFTLDFRNDTIKIDDTIISHSAQILGYGFENSRIVFLGEAKGTFINFQIYNNGILEGGFDKVIIIDDLWKNRPLTINTQTNEIIYGYNYYSYLQTKDYIEIELDETYYDETLDFEYELDNNIDYKLFYVINNHGDCLYSEEPLFYSWKYLDSESYKSIIGDLFNAIQEFGNTYSNEKPTRAKRIEPYKNTNIQTTYTHFTGTIYGRIDLSGFEMVNGIDLDNNSHAYYEMPRLINFTFPKTKDNITGYIRYGSLFSDHNGNYGDTLTIKGDISNWTQLGGLLNRVNNYIYIDITELHIDPYNLTMLYNYRQYYDADWTGNLVEKIYSNNLYISNEVWNADNKLFASFPVLVGQNGYEWEDTDDKKKAKYALVNKNEVNGYFSLNYDIEIFKSPNTPLVNFTYYKRDNKIYFIRENEEGGESFTIKKCYYIHNNEQSEEFINLNSMIIDLDETGLGTYKIYITLEEAPESINPYDPSIIDNIVSDINDYDIPLTHGVGYNNSVMTLYKPTTTEINNLINILKNKDSTFTGTLRELWNNSMLQIDKYIMGLYYVPGNFTAAGSKNITIGFLPSDISMTYTNNTHVTLSLGSLEIPKLWNNHLDYSPYTQIEIYLPFIGVRNLNTDEVMGKTISLSYEIEGITGDVLAIISVNGNIRYTFTGNAKFTLPLSSENLDGLISTLGTVACLGIGAAVGGVGLAAAGSVGGALNSETDESGKIINESIETMTNPHSLTQTSPHNDSASGNSAYMGLNYAYISIIRTIPDLPDNYGHIKGYPLNEYGVLNNYKGFSIIENIDLSGLNLTLNEQNALKGLLRNGVYL